MATIEPTTLALKDGREFSIRTPVETDAVPVLEYARVLLEEGIGSVTTPEEFTLTVEEETKWIADYAANPNALVLLAEHEGAPIGLLNFLPSDRKRLSHGGTFGITVLREFRGQGVGRALIEQLLAWARANPGVTRVGLSVLSDNEPAIVLYRKLDFIEEGRRINYVRMGENEYLDDVMMYLLV